MLKIMVVAIEDNYGIGSSKSVTGLPWDNKDEMKHFVKTTKGNNVPGKYAMVMGEVTYRKILSSKLKTTFERTNLYTANPLRFEGRDVFVLTEKSYPGHMCVNDIDKIQGYDVLFVCGGKMVYNDCISLKMADGIIVSRIKGSFDCDTAIIPFEKGMHLLYRDDRGSFVVEMWAYNKDTPTIEKLLKYVG